MIALFGLFAEVERDLISERTKEGLAAAKAKGKRLGRSKGALGKSRLDGKGARQPGPAGHECLEGLDRQDPGRLPFRPLSLHPDPQDRSGLTPRLGPPCCCISAAIWALLYRAFGSAGSQGPLRVLEQAGRPSRIAWDAGTRSWSTLQADPPRLFLIHPLFHRKHRQGDEDAGAGVHFQGHGAEQPLPTRTAPQRTDPTNVGGVGGGERRVDEPHRTSGRAPFKGSIPPRGRDHRSTSAPRPRSEQRLHLVSNSLQRR